MSRNLAQLFNRHPKRRALQAWLAGDTPPQEGAELDAHLASCRQCAATLEDLDATGDLAIGDALAAVLAPPTGLSDRLERKVTARLDSRVVFDVVSDLFGAGLETSRLLLTEEPPDE